MGQWDSPINADMSAVDSMFSNNAIIGLTNANVTLTTPPNSGAAWSGPYQSQSAVLRFTGTLTGNCTITIPVPGFFIVENFCTVGAFSVILAAASPGQVVCAPPGESCHIYSGSTNVRYVNLGRVGSYLDQAVSTVPAWMTNCTVPPYLVCDGTVYNAAVLYGGGQPTPLLNLLGPTFGGNGITTFGVPDLRNRSRISLGGGSGRVTTAGSGIDGTTINSSGGAQNETLAAGQIPQMTTGTESTTHTHGYTVASNVAGSPPGAGSGLTTPGSAQTGTESATHTHIVGSASPTPVITMPPTLVAGLTFIKT